ncbi:hypothetical protein C8Q70DRAFT_596452 [Cubamyces menziesii]|nr:hypothetical protein C8Q70DRAFT_596452 [Cubamyces menziesii]
MSEDEGSGDFTGCCGELRSNPEEYKAVLNCSTACGSPESVKHLDDAVSDVCVVLGLWTYLFTPDMDGSSGSSLSNIPPAQSSSRTSTRTGATSLISTSISTSPSVIPSLQTGQSLSRIGAGTSPTTPLPISTPSSNVLVDSSSSIGDSSISSPSNSSSTSEQPTASDSNKPPDQIGSASVYTTIIAAPQTLPNHSSTSSLRPTSAPLPNHSPAINPAIIVGAILGAVLFLILLVVMYTCVKRLKRRATSQNDEQSVHDVISKSVRDHFHGDSSHYYQISREFQAVELIRRQ